MNYNLLTLIIVAIIGYFSFNIYGMLVFLGFVALGLLLFKPFKNERK